MINISERVLGVIRDEKGFNGKFDSHYFIKRFRAHNEACYLKIIDKYRDGQQDNRAIMRTNAEVARMLSRNAEKLGIRKCGKVQSQNDHGHNTLNELWRVVGVLILFVSIGFNATSQTSDQFDLPTKSMVEEYKYVIIQNYINQIIRQANRIDEALDLQCNLEHQLSMNDFALFDKFRTMNNIKRRSKYKKEEELSKLKKSILEYKKHIKGLEVSKDDDNPVISKWPVDSDVQIIDAIPVIRKITLSKENIWEYEKQLRQNDRDKFYEGYEWVLGKKRYVEQTFPTKVSYYEYEGHPEYVCVNKTVWYPRSEKTIYGLFDKTGRLVRNINPDVDREEAMEKIQHLFCFQDFKNNKYDIKSYGTEIVRSVDRLLSGEFEEYEKLERAAESVGATAAILEYRNPVKNRSEIAKYKVKYNEIERKLSKFNKTAISYVKQLKKDHADYGIKSESDNAKLYDGRIVRKDDTSFYFSYVNEKGKMVHLILVQDIQDGAFNFKRKISVIQ